MLSKVNPLSNFPFSFLFASRCSICHAFLCRSSFLPETNRPLSPSPKPKTVFFFFFLFLRLEVSIYPSPPLWGSLSLSLVSPLLCIVSAVSVRTVIAAVTSLGENKVVLCSWHHKRHKRKEPKPNRKDSKRRN